MPERIKFDELYERIKDHRTALLATVTQGGYVHARPMMTQEREADADLWFVTAMDTEKVDEIKAHPRVGVIYFRESDGAYVSIEGEAHIVQDKDAIRARWKDAWRMWFPEGPEQANLCLIKVDAHGAEYWEPKGTKLTVMFEMARSRLTGDHPEINPPEQIDLQR